MAEEGAVACEVAYARPDRQFVIPLRLAGGATVRQAFLQALESELRSSCPEIDADTAVLGIFGKVVPNEQAVREGDRIEIYRPLTVDPRSARLERVGAMRKTRK